MNVHWFTGATNDHLANMGFDYATGSYNSQFRAMMRNYTFYYVYGVSIKFQPAAFGQSATNTKAIRRFEVATYVSNTEGSPQDNDLRNAKGYKMYHPAQSWSKFFRSGKYLKRLNQGWQKEGTELPQEDKLKTAIKCWGEGFGGIGSSELG